VIPASPPEPEFPSQLIARMRGHARTLTPVPTNLPARLTGLPAIRVVLFDVYGTLLISASGDISSTDGRGRSRALGEALETLGVPVDEKTAQGAADVLAGAIKAAHERLRDRGVEYPEVDVRGIVLEILRHLGAGGSGSTEPDRAFCEALAVEYECRSNPTWPMPGVVETLRALRARKLSLGIISNAQFFTPLLFPAHLEQSLEMLGFDADLCVWSYRLLEAKPSPRLFTRPLEVLSRRGVGPGQVLYVGNDSLNDIRPSARLGMRTALFAGDKRSYRPREGDPRVGGVRADILLTDLRQLADVLPLD
jgi:putative hydrolase of the HAD superfamily